MATLFELSQEMMLIEHELIENGGEITPELETALAETQESMLQKVDGYNNLINKMKATSEACKHEIDRISAIKKTTDNAIKNIKSHVLEVMKMYGMNKLDGNFCKVSIRNTKSVEVDEEMLMSVARYGVQDLQDSLPPYMTVEVKINKTELKKYIQETGITPAGVEMVENQSLMVK